VSRTAPGRPEGDAGTTWIVTWVGGQRKTVCAICADNDPQASRTQAAQRRIVQQETREVGGASRVRSPGVHPRGTAVTYLVSVTTG